MFNSSLQTIEQFKRILLQLPSDCFDKPCDVLSNASIGQHARHVIELYTCLIDGYGPGKVNYDKRQRNKRIERELDFAIARLEYIQQNLKKDNKEMEVSYELGENEVVIPSNYFREVMYNLEHAIHHNALIRIGINRFTEIELPESFGVAPSTMQYREACAQ